MSRCSRFLLTVLLLLLLVGIIVFLSWTVWEQRKEIAGQTKINKELSLTISNMIKQITKDEEKRETNCAKLYKLLEKERNERERKEAELVKKHKGGT